MHTLYVLTAAALLVSFASDRQKSVKALKMAWKKFFKIVPSFLSMLIMVAVVLYLVPDVMVSQYLGQENTTAAFLLGAVFGSITLIPGFIAFPLSGILLGKGVPYMVLSAFTTTLMIVGVLSFPVERAYFGTRATIIRNALSFCIAIVVALGTGLYFGELVP